MKKKIIILLLFVALVFGASFYPNRIKTVEASSATSYSYALDNKGNFTKTQDAYLPSYTNTSMGLKAPGDIIVGEDDNLYIADTSNSRIVIFDPITCQIVGTIEHEDMVTPTGIYIRSGKLFIADKLAHQIFVYDLNNNVFLESYTKPSETSFTADEFSPLKVSTDVRGNLYVVCDNLYEGVVQLEPTGRFIGYYATNKVTTTLLEKIQNLLYTDAQKELMKKKTPPLFSNLYNDENGILYTTTTYASSYTYVKKHNTSGGNMWGKYPLIADNDLSDIYVDQYGLVYVSSASKGYITIYTNEGEFITTFGGAAGSTDISGLFKKISGLVVDKDENIWVLDSEKSTLQKFTPTPYSLTIYEAITKSNNSIYNDTVDESGNVIEMGSISLWKEVIKLNQMSCLAHNNLGLDYLYDQQYDLAMEHLKIANNKSGYSNAYWEIRNIWLQSNLTWLILLIVGIILVSFVLGKFNKKYHFLDKWKEIKHNFFARKRVKDFTLIFHTMKHPSDAFYEIKKHRQATIPSTIIWMVLLFITYILFLTGKGFIYQYVDATDLDLFSIVIGFFAILFVFIYCNYLVTSITDGNGGFGDIFKTVIYSCGPAIIGMLIATIMSHFATENEAFFLDLIFKVGLAWTVILIFYGMMEVQGYSFWENIKSLLLTALLMFVFLIVLLILLVISKQLLEFIETLFKEVIRNVRS